MYFLLLKPGDGEGRRLAAISDRQRLRSGSGVISRYREAARRDYFSAVRVDRRDLKSRCIEFFALGIKPLVGKTRYSERLNRVGQYGDVKSDFKACV